jgi:predicted RNA-binding protein with PIN domain
MLLYIIDGFNLIHKVPALKNSSFVHRDLLYYLKHHRLTGSTNNKVIVVFDGCANSDVAGERMMRVVFGCERSADEVIKEYLRTVKNTSEIVVVSDDREIRSATRAAGARALHCSEFLGIKKERQPKETAGNEKEISYPLQREITEEMRKVWLKE